MRAGSPQEGHEARIVRGERRCWVHEKGKGCICLTHVESAPLAATMESTKTRGSQQGAALMKRTTKYVALDVHQATTVASVREESGRVIARSVLPTDRGALTEFVRGMRGARHVPFEEGTKRSGCTTCWRRS